MRSLTSSALSRGLRFDRCGARHCVVLHIHQWAGEGRNVPTGSSRAMSVGLAYAIANAIFGGSAEYVALWFKNSGAETSFYWYVTFMCAIAFVASILMPDPKIKGYLQGEGTER